MIIIIMIIQQRKRKKWHFLYLFSSIKLILVDTVNRWFDCSIEERKLGLEEKPLLVQLNWHIDDREGRFLLRRIDDKTNAQGVGFAEGTSFRRKLSKREKKQMKKQEKLSRLKSAGETEDTTLTLDQNGVAEKLYTGSSIFLLTSKILPTNCLQIIFFSCWIFERVEK